VNYALTKHRAESWYPPAGGPENCHGARIWLWAGARIRV